MRTTARWALGLALLAVMPGFAAGARAQPAPTHAEVRARLVHPPSTRTTARPLPPPPAPDRWLAFDKAQHAAFAFLSVVGGQYTLVRKAGWSERRALPVSMGFGAALGLGKELYDWRVGPRRTFSRRDLAADAFGILLAAGFILL
ncbi:hypothetical protein [Rhodocaloribacter sp.]